MKKLFKREEGFTIIEVVLVLAIAGLIFLVVFLALPQLQKSRRDTQRKSDAGRAVAALESYAGNNAGVYPADVGDFTSDIIPAYLTEGDGTASDPYTGWNDPSTGDVYDEGSEPADISDLDTGEYWYETEAICDGQTVDSGTGNARDVAFVMYQESGGQYCQDNR